MLFNSILYLLFFPIVYLIHWSLSGKARLIFLFTASLFFYGIWGVQREGITGVRWLILFFSLVTITFIFIRLMLRFPEKRKWFLIGALFFDLGNLIVFKYTGFIIRLFIRSGITPGVDPAPFDLFLPLAISFYTFQLIAYTVDVYRGIVKERVSFLQFSVFILFFPQLIAGPIMRSSDFMEQMEKPWINRERMFTGIWYIMGGLVKKAIIADPMGSIIQPVFSNPGVHSWWSIFLAGVGFSLQVYGDFSGYTDMARGSAYLLGYEIPENFIAPYFSRSAQELWQRWHITLASWLRDYIYIPLGGSRVGNLRTYLNLMITFTLGGLWHGADLTYLAWGALWGVLLAIERFIERATGFRFKDIKNPVLNVVRILIVFFVFVLGAIMFRSQPVKLANGVIKSDQIMVEMLTGLFTNSEGQVKSILADSSIDSNLYSAVFGEELFRSEKIEYPGTIFLMFLAVFFFHCVQYFKPFFLKFRKYDRVLIPVSATLLGGYLLPVVITGSHQFIYFVF